MSTFSEEEIVDDFQKGSYYEIKWENEDDSLRYVDPKEDLEQMLKRVSLVKEALALFEKETGAQCQFKGSKQNGLIVIRKLQ